MRSLPLFLASIVTFVVCRPAVAQQGKVTKDQGNSVRIITVGPRALKDALVLAGSQLGCPINYEDATYQAESNTEELVPNLILVPKTTSVIFDCVRNSTTPNAVIEELVRSYNSTNRTLSFQVSSPKYKVISVTPLFEVDKSGRKIPSKSLLDAKISIDAVDTYSNIAKSICAQVTSQSSGMQVSLGYPASTDFLNRKVHFKSSAGSALTCLNALLAGFNEKFGQLLSWSLDVDPGFHASFVNLHTLAISDPNPAQRPDSIIFVDSQRPLLDGSLQIASQVGKSLIYEDTPFLCSCQVLKGRDGVPYVPSGGIFDFSYSNSSSPYKIFSDAVKAYNTPDHVGRFLTKQSGQAILIYPTEYKEDEGLHDYKPLLDTIISLNADQEPVDSVLRKICQLLSQQTKKKITLGKVDDSLSKIKLSLKAPKQSTAAYLTDVVSALGKQTFFKLLYDPHTSGFILDASVELNQKGKDPKAA